MISSLLNKSNILRKRSLSPGQHYRKQLGYIERCLQLAVFIKSEMLQEVRENRFSKNQRYPIITIESQNKTIVTDKRHNNDVSINYNITNILVTQVELSLQCPPKLLLWFVISFVFAKRGSTTMGSSLFVTLVGD